MEEGSVDLVLAQVSTVLGSPRIAPPLKESNDASRFRILAQKERLVPVIRSGQEDLFRLLWRLNIPVVVEGLQPLLRGAWTPHYFAQTHGVQSVTMLKSDGLPPERVSLARFFEEFAKRDEDRGHAVKLKVKKSLYQRRHVFMIQSGLASFFIVQATI